MSQLAGRPAGAKGKPRLFATVTAAEKAEVDTFAKERGIKTADFVRYCVLSVIRREGQKSPLLNTIETSDGAGTGWKCA